ncbi:TMEM175 family protein [Flagellimonas sp. DF-77]|uniref:TMEM175 family protein n=1 Tax=Flagellimonas algarum TaxID=3230298 RepID=UPI0033932E14
MKKRLIDTTKKVSPEGFRYRGLQTTRLENLSDAVFGFAITLLVISSQVPKNYLELQVSMYGFLGFIFCTMLLLGLWNNHSNFFLHYGLVDTTTKMLNALFLFVLLFYVYPLKYLFSYLGTAIYVLIKKAIGDDSAAMRQTLDGLYAEELNPTQWKDLMIRFGLGLFFIYLMIMFMHVNALKKANELELDNKERFITKTFIYDYLLLMMVTVISMGIVLIFGGTAASYSGMAYLLTPMILPLFKRYRKKKARKLGF